MQRRWGTAVLAAMVLISLVGFNRLGARLLLGSFEIGTTNHEQRPIAVLKRTEWDFGTVSAGPTLRAAFPVRNAGNRRLILREHSRSCDCVSAARPSIIVQPGESVELVTTL